MMCPISSCCLHDNMVPPKNSCRIYTSNCNAFLWSAHPYHFGRSTAQLQNPSLLKQCSLMSLSHSCSVFMKEICLHVTWCGCYTTDGTQLLIYAFIAVTEFCLHNRSCSWYVTVLKQVLYTAQACTTCCV